jgi:hypothetical protein
MLSSSLCLTSFTKAQNHLFVMDDIVDYPIPPKAPPKPALDLKVPAHVAVVRPQPAAVAREAKSERRRFGPTFKVLENNLRTIVESDVEAGGAPVGEHGVFGATIPRTDNLPVSPWYYGL